MNATVKRLLFSPEEDKLITRTAKKMGIDRASIILERQLKRPRRIIREHFKNALDPNTNPVFREEDDIKLLELVREYGTQWGIISRILSSKSPSHIKSRYNVLLAKIKRGEVLPNGKRTSKYKNRKVKNRRYRSGTAKDEYSSDESPENSDDDEYMTKKLKKLWDGVKEEDVFEN